MDWHKVGCRMLSPSSDILLKRQSPLPRNMHHMLFRGEMYAIWLRLTLPADSHEMTESRVRHIVSSDPLDETLFSDERFESVRFHGPPRRWSPKPVKAKGRPRSAR